MMENIAHYWFKLESKVSNTRLKGSSSYFTSNIKRIYWNEVISIPHEIIRKGKVFRWFKEEQKVINSRKSA